MSQQGVFKQGENIVQIPGYIKSDKNDFFYLVCQSGKKYEIQFEGPLLRELKKYAGNNVFLSGIISDDKLSVRLSHLRQDDRFRNHTNNNFAPVDARDDSPESDFDSVDEEESKNLRRKTAS